MFSSARERRLWIAAAVWLVAVYASLAFVRGPIEYLRERNLLRITVAVLFLAVAGWILSRLLRRRPGRAEIAVLVAAGLVFLIVLWLTELPEERVHFLEYGVFGGLVYEALRERRRRLPLHGPGRGAPALRRWPGPVAVVLTGLAGWGDEGIQAVLPDRFYDLRDVGLNLAGGLLVVASMALLARARRRDEGGAPPER